MITDTERRALRLIRSTGGRALRPAGEALLLAGVSGLLRAGLIAHGTARRPWIVTAAGRIELDSPD